MLKMRAPAQRRNTKGACEDAAALAEELPEELVDALDREVRVLPYNYNFENLRLTITRALG